LDPSDSNFVKKHPTSSIKLIVLIKLPDKKIHAKICTGLFLTTKNWRQPKLKALKNYDGIMRVELHYDRIS